MNSKYSHLKNSDTIYEIRILIFHLTNDYEQYDGVTYFSGFCGALKDARKMTGRNLVTGQKDRTNTPDVLGNWLGAVGYFSLLNQIGNCFENKEKNIKIKGKKSEIILALKNFTNLDDDTIAAIYALRNAFSHDYSLINIYKNHPDLNYHFSVFADPNLPLIEHSKIKWDGSLNSLSEDTKTKVNLEALGDLTEQICSSLPDMAKNGKLNIALPGGAEELLRRYSFVDSKQP